MSKKRAGGWPGGLTNVLMLLKGACRQHGLSEVPPSPYEMGKRIISHLGLCPPEDIKEQKKILWLCAYLKEAGYKKAPYAKSMAKTVKKAGAPTATTKDEFYKSWEWTTLRMKILKRYGRVCMCCGAVPGFGVVLNVDHIKPLSKYWELRLDPDNLQVLCHPCNKGKGAWDETDYRS